MMLLAGDGIRVAQVQPGDGPDGDPGDEIVPDEAATTTTEERRPKLLRGIDISHWQNRENNDDIDFEQIRNGGNRFAFIKATESTDHLDTWFDRNFARARAAGMAVGGYHAFDYTIDGKAQADHFIDRLEASNGIDGALPPAVDVECWSYRGASTHVLAATRLRDFVDQVYKRTGRLPVLYTSARMWSEVMGNATGFDRLPLWAVCWGCQAPPTLAAGWDEWTFWQTGARRVPGRTNKVDGNVFSGKRKDLNALKLKPFTIDGGAAVTGKQRAVLELGGRDAIAVRTSPDGEQWGKWSPVRGKARVDLGEEEGEQTLFVQLRGGPGMRSPVLSDSITLDLTSPEISRPSVVLREGPIGNGPGSVPITVEWTAEDAVAGLSDASVSVSCGEGQIQRTEAPGSAEPGQIIDWSGEAALFEDAPCEVTAIARDGVGNTARKTVRGVQARLRPVSGGTPTIDTNAAQVGIVAERGPDRGRAAVVVDGEAVGLVDLYAPIATGPEIVFVAETGTDASQTVAVEGTGTADPASSGTGISIDGFVTLSVSV
jgi:GH25 family lysozyme M1 (1,4-beta-N-acetylmuramidase)